MHSANRRAALLVMIGLLATACDKSTAPPKPGPPARMELTSGDGLSALAGTAIATPLSVTVRDAKGMLVPNVTVSFAVTAGGGSVNPASATTNANGVAGGVTWTIGKLGGAQTATATVDTVIKTFSASTQSQFTVVLRFFGPAMPAAAQAAFTNAANRIRAALVGQLSSVPLNGVNLSGCGVNGLTDVLNETATGVIIYAAFAPVDGAGKILAQSGPCLIRGTTTFPVVGVMKFDEADWTGSLTTGRFESVVLHEMNHVVGFGTIWEDKSLLKTPTWSFPFPQTYPDSAVLTGSVDPRFTGAAAMAQCTTLGGTANHCTANGGVAVETCGDPGTADGHWREMFTTNCTGGSARTPVGGTPAFDSELMTGYAEATAAMPWSTMTIASFQDLGYTVNLLAADAFTVPSLMSYAAMRAQEEAFAAEHATEQLLRPRFTVGADGSVRLIKRRPRN